VLITCSLVYLPGAPSFYRLVDPINILLLVWRAPCSNQFLLLLFFVSSQRQCFTCCPSNRFFSLLHGKLPSSSRSSILSTSFFFGSKPIGLLSITSNLLQSSVQSLRASSDIDTNRSPDQQHVAVALYESITHFMIPMVTHTDASWWSDTWIR